MNKNIPQYLTKLITSNPQIKSGRKNYQEQHDRVLKQLNLIKKYYKKIKI